MHWHLRDRILDLTPRALVMGIVNVTPDSFSDGGRHATTDAAVAHALKLVEEGADLLDIGGESSRPGAQPVPLEEELARVVPVVRELAQRTDVPLSVDTVKAEVARQALDAGAHIINDITALAGREQDANASSLADICLRAGAGVVLMHMRGTPGTMQVNPAYTDVVAEVCQELQIALRRAEERGIAASRLVLDPGIGFGKTTDHNLRLLANLRHLETLGRPLLLGVSRKGFLGATLGRPLEERLAGSLAAAAYGLASGVRIVRVHDVAATRDLVRLFEALDAVRFPTARRQGGRGGIPRTLDEETGS
jgi:dihydropteroate synthase